MSLICRESYQLQSHSRGLYMSTDILLAVICLNRVLLPNLRLLLVRVCEAWRRDIRGEEGAERERLEWNEAIEITEVRGKQEACQKQIRVLMELFQLFYAETAARPLVKSAVQRL